jgi:hypothetical protein
MDVTDVSKVHSASIFKLYPEDGGSVYFRNREKTPHIHRIQRPKSRTDVSEVVNVWVEPNLWNTSLQEKEKKHGGMKFGNHSTG